jgi:hypothetical protein
MSLFYSRDKFTFNYLTNLIRFGAILQEKLRPQTTTTFYSLARADVSVAPVQVKMEYVVYIKLYGVPLYGVFDESLLAKIRADFNL